MTTHVRFFLLLSKISELNNLTKLYQSKADSVNLEAIIQKSNLQLFVMVIL